MLDASEGAGDRALLDGARALTRHGLAIGSLGNVSARQDDRVRITPTRVPYDTMSADDLVTVGLDGEQLAGRCAPSVELPLHLAVYGARADVRAIVHSHSPHAVAWSFLGCSLAPEIEEQSYYGIGDVRVTGPAPPGSARLAADAAATLGDARAVLLARHGAIAVGETVADAVLVARIVEHHAQIAWLLRREERR